MNNLNNNSSQSGSSTNPSAKPGGFKGRMTFVMVSCLLVAGTIITRAAYIQFWTNPRLEQMSRRQFQSKVLIRPRRGMVSDRNGEPLAINIETNSLAANPLKIQNRKTLLRLLTKATDLPASKIAQRLGEKKEFVWLKRHLSDAEMNRLKKWRIIDADGDLMTGMWLVKESQRVYPHGELAAHTLGDVNVDSEGVEGVELWQEDKMRGKVVSVSAIKDALGRPSLIDAVAAKSVEDGEPVKLTIDASLQFAVEQALRDSMVKTGSKAGSVIAMNAVNGEILAMANQPSFNPNLKGAALERRRNRVLTDGYEPGSTLKAVLIASALTHGWKLTDGVNCEHGSFTVQGKRISEAEVKEKFDWLNLRKIIQFSSNVGAAKVALKLGADNYYKTLKEYGFGNKTGIGFPGEISGRVPPRKDWQPLSLANIGFGQGVLVTPMQMTRAYASFLNGGYLVTPTLIKDDAKVIDPKDAPKRVISEKVAADVMNALAAVTEEKGTGVKARLDGYDVSGKTGTAQLVDPNTGGYSRSKHVASFIGYAVGVEPKIVILTKLDEPKGVYFAAETAVPLFKEVLTAVVNRFSIPSKNEENPATLANSKLASNLSKNAKDHLKNSQAKAIEVNANGSANADETNSNDLAAQSLQWQSATATGQMIWKMPQLRGLTIREAVKVLHGHSFKLEARGDGIIQTQSPEEGHPLTEGEVVRLGLVDP